MNNQFEIKERSPLNNCYVIVAHNFNILEERFENSEHSFQEYLEKNEALMQLHLSLLHLALRKIPSGKILFLLGHGGDGKGRHALLQGGHLLEISWISPGIPFQSPGILS